MDFRKNRLPSGLYIHIPFCKVKCRYCAFAVFPGLRGHTDRYLKALANEMMFYLGQSIDTIYFGGGTPSILPAENWDRIMAKIRSCFVFAPEPEITVECNPENISPELIQTFRKLGVNRISLGLQTTDGFLLKKIGRTHSFSDFLNAYLVCRRGGIKNLSVDLIFGLPGQTLNGWLETLDRVLELQPEHFSLYPLDVEKKSAFYFDGVQADPNLQAEQYELTQERMGPRGYENYEVFSYALQGYRCRHNLKYWENGSCIGVGLSAAGYDGNARAQNTGRFWDYIESIESGNLPVMDIERLSPIDRLREKIMLGLRLKEGLLYTPEMNAGFGAILERLVNEGILQFSQNRERICATRRGWILSNYIYRELLG